MMLVDEYSYFWQHFSETQLLLAAEQNHHELVAKDTARLRHS